jgi:hypothetical protein
MDNILNKVDHSKAEVGKVNLKCNAHEALRDDFFFYRIAKLKRSIKPGLKKSNYR